MGSMERLTWIATTICCLFVLYSQTHGGDYNRKNWTHWSDEDQDGVNTRQEVLIEESVPESLVILAVSGKKIKIVKGFWVCPFTGDTITNPRELDVDHLVPLKHAYEHGAKRWSKKKKKEFANYLKDPDHLVAVKASANRQKGAKHPGEWMPKVNRGWYVNSWHNIKRKWKLEIDMDEIPKEIK